MSNWWGLLRKHFVMDLFCYRRPFVKETFCYGFVLLKETFCSETFWMESFLNASKDSRKCGMETPLKMASKPNKKNHCSLSAGTCAHSSYIMSLVQCPVSLYILFCLKSTCTAQSVQNIIIVPPANRQNLHTEASGCRSVWTHFDQKSNNL
jgi:hypothetical protein